MICIEPLPKFAGDFHAVSILHDYSSTDALNSNSQYFGTKMAKRYHRGYGQKRPRRHGGGGHRHHHHQQAPPPSPQIPAECHAARYFRCIFGAFFSCIFRAVTALSRKSQVDRDMVLKKVTGRRAGRIAMIVFSGACSWVGSCVVVGHYRLRIVI